MLPEKSASDLILGDYVVAWKAAITGIESPARTSSYVFHLDNGKSKVVAKESVWQVGEKPWWRVW